MTKEKRSEKSVQWLQLYFFTGREIVIGKRKTTAYHISFFAFAIGNKKTDDTGASHHHSCYSELNPAYIPINIKYRWAKLWKVRID